MQQSAPIQHATTTAERKLLSRQRNTGHSATGLSELLSVNAKSAVGKLPRAIAALVTIAAFLLFNWAERTTLLMSPLTAVPSAPDIPPIVLIGQPGIFSIANQVDPAQITTPEFQKKLEVLKVKMQEERGAGIAGPQIGWNASVFVVGVDSSHPAYRNPAGAFALTEADVPIQWWINPRIVAQSEKEVYAWEGCMSVPGMRGWVRRPTSITLEGYDSRGVWRQSKFDGLVSRLVQHEHSHLSGELFTEMVDDARFLVPKASFEYQSSWPKNWPSAGARDTPVGGVSSEQ